MSNKLRKYRNRGLFPIFEDFDHLFNLLPYVSSNVQNSQYSERLGQTDVIKTEKEYKFSIDVPGLTKEDVKINIDGQELRVSAERNTECGNNSDNEEFLVCERSHRRFDRSWTLPKDINLDESEAKVTNGVLTISLPRINEKANKKKIEIM